MPAVTVSSGSLVIEGCQFTDSVAKEDAGGAFLQGWALMCRALLSCRTVPASLPGPAAASEIMVLHLAHVACRLDTVTISGCNFTGNTASGSGGGLYMTDNQRQTVNRSTFGFNTARSEFRASSTRSATVVSSCRSCSSVALDYCRWRRHGRQQRHQRPCFVCDRSAKQHCSIGWRPVP
jgi:parallel beta-helix repeat protein